MSVIAKGEITLNPVNDAYTVSITPSSCTIPTDFNGLNHNLDNAKGIISIKRGAKVIPFKITSIAKSSVSINVSCPVQSGVTVPFAITQIGADAVSEYVDFNIETTDGFAYITTVRFPFSVIREASMLDWIQDWDGSKTKIGGTYIMTPKLFVGSKDDVLEDVDGIYTWKKNAITGVYIGPDLLSSGESSVGIYGYKNDKQIFYINANGGFISGWAFNETELQSSNNVVHILSEGTIFAQNLSSTVPFWGIYADGRAVFASGNVKFNSDGSAEYAGSIKSASGTIGGWAITSNQLYSERIIFDSKNKYIGINANALQKIDPDTGDVIFPSSPSGAIKLWYNSANDFGLAGWASSDKVFQLGSSNQIAGWQFNHQAIWSGSSSPSLTQGGYATTENALTLAPNGIRSNKWYIDANGTASFVEGSVKFNTGNAEMFGWLMRSGRFSSKHAALVSDEQNAGVYISLADISEVNVGILRTAIQDNGGIYLCSNDESSELRAYDTNSKLSFQLSSSGYNKIGAWSFDHESIYTGNKQLLSTGYAQNTESLVLSVNGLAGAMWKLQKDGSGAIAGGNISWDTSGNVTLSDKISLSWSSIANAPNLTKIDANGIYTGTISADNITTGTISTAAIKCEGKWALNSDGSGYLASNNLYWEINGNLNIQGNLSLKTLRYLQSHSYDDYNADGWLIDDAFIVCEMFCDHIFRLPHLQSGEFRIIRYFGVAVSRTNYSTVFKVANAADSIVIGSSSMSTTYYKELDMASIDVLHYGVGYFDIIGRGSRDEEATYWHIIPLNTESYA